jgi:Bacterial Ig domain
MEQGEKMKSWRVICVGLTILTVIGSRTVSADTCLVSGQRYKLTEEIVDWSMKIGSAQKCVRDFRLNTALSSSPGHVAIEAVKLVSPPEFGQVIIDDASLSYTASPGFKGADSFTVVVSGIINGVPGSSTIRIAISVAGDASVLPGPGSHARGLVTVPANQHSMSIGAGAPFSGTTPRGAIGGWKTLKIGAGGFITGINIAADGSKVVRTDTYGAYVWDAQSSIWKQVVTSYSMPGSDVRPDVAGGVYEIAIAPSSTSTLYMLFNGYVYRSNNSGAAWTKTAFRRVANIDPNDSTKGMGRFIAVDPANADIAYVGTPSDGLWGTSNGGKTWSQVGSVGAGTPPSGGKQGGGHLISFDPTSSVIGGVTQGIFVSTYGTGVYHSIDGGASWTLTARTPTTHRHMIVDQDGNVFLTDNSSSGNTPNLWKYANGKWSNPTGTGANLGRAHSIAVDPANSKRIYVGIESGDLMSSTNGGVTWSGIAFNQATRTAKDIPWLAWTNESYMSNGDMAFDPSGSNLLYFAEGIGVWNCNPSSSYGPVRWNSQNSGIEQLVGNLVLAPPGGKPIVLAWDRPVFYVNNPEVYPSRHGPNNVNEIVMGWSADWASTSPATIVAIMNWWGVDVSGISTDGGRNWRAFAALPGEVPSKIGGSIAAASPTDFVWVTSNHGNPWRTTDGGSNWTEIKIPGVPSSGETGWGFSYYLNRQIVAADRVDPDTFYLYNYGPSNRVAAAGLYRSTDKGISWTHVFSGEIARYSSYNAKLRSVPGQAGHLFFTSGPQSGPHPADTPFMRSSDGGKTWSPVGDFKEVYAFGFGAAYPGQSYPAIFVVGYNRGVWGIWRSIDNAGSWSVIGDFPLGSFDAIKSIDGDKVTIGTVYIGFNGSGFAYKEN